MAATKNRRILIIDDNPSIQDDFRKILENVPQNDTALHAKETLLFGEAQSAQRSDGFEVDSAFQGEEGLDLIVRAREQGRPYALAFVDVRMPPGIDGVETIERIWPTDLNIQVVLCSAYSDYSAQDILLRLGISDRLLMLRKPCDVAEILLISTALCEKWNLARDNNDCLEAAVMIEHKGR